MAITHFFAKTLINYQSENSPAFKLRKKRAERIKTLIEECYEKNGKVNIIDIGGTRTYWNIFPKHFLIEKKVQVTIVNLPSKIPPPQSDDIFSFISGDGCNLSGFADNSFHIAHSNSVIEHVGNNFSRAKFAKEIKRVAETYYLQTPNYWFPVEPHFVTPFFHWLPKPLRIKLVRNFDLGWFKKAKDYHEAKKQVDSCNLLRRRDLTWLFPEAIIHKEKIAILNKSFVLMNKKAA